MFAKREGLWSPHTTTTRERTKDLILVNWALVGRRSPSLLRNTLSFTLTIWLATSCGLRFPIWHQGVSITEDGAFFCINFVIKTNKISFTKCCLVEPQSAQTIPNPSLCYTYSFISKTFFTLKFIIWALLYIHEAHVCFNSAEPIFSIWEYTNFEWSTKWWFNRHSLICSGCFLLQRNKPDVDVQTCTFSAHFPLSLIWTRWDHFWKISPGIHLHSQVGWCIPNRDGQICKTLLR